MIPLDDRDAFAYRPVLFFIVRRLRRRRCLVS
jgi:hypothetical protein